MERLTLLHNYTLHQWYLGVVFVEGKKLLSRHGCKQTLIDEVTGDKGRNCGRHNCNVHPDGSASPEIVSYYNVIKSHLRYKFDITVWNKEVITYLNTELDHTCICSHTYKRGNLTGKVCGIINCNRHKKQGIKTKYRQTEYSSNHNTKRVCIENMK